MHSKYLKVPVEMATFALTEHKIKQVSTYLASQFIYSGNAHSRDKPVHKIAELTGYPVKSVYRYAKWLIKRNWFGKSPQGRYYFNGIRRVHQFESWRFARAVIMQPKDFKNFKAFISGVAISNLAITKARHREHKATPRKHRSKNSAGLSISYISNCINISASMAYRIRKLANKAGYIKSEPNLIRIINLTPHDLKAAKASNISKIPVQLFGYPGTFYSNIDKIRYKSSQLYLQEPNQIVPMLPIKSFKGLSKYRPPSVASTVSLK